MNLLLAKWFRQEQSINKNKAISNQGNKLTLGSSNGICDRPLNGRENSTTTNTHDQHTRSLLGILSEILDGESEDSWIHATFEEEDCNEDDDGANSSQADRETAKECAHECVDGENMTGVEEFHQSSGNKSTNGENGKCHRKEIRAKGVGDISIDFCDVVEEEGGERDLRCD